jgi:hypothetical protein
MGYLKTPWNLTTAITPERLNNIESQYDEAKKDLDAHNNLKQGVHGVPSGKFIAVTSQENGNVKWSEIDEKDKAIEEARLNNSKRFCLPVLSQDPGDYKVGEIYYLSQTGFQDNPTGDLTGTTGN